jgi:hypothetical protein
VLAAFGLLLLVAGGGLLIFTRGERLSLALLLLLPGAGLLSATCFSLVSARVRADRRRFSVTGPPRVVVYNETGSIRVKADADATRVTVKVALRTHPFGKAADHSWVRYEHSPEDNEIRAAVGRVLAPGTTRPQAIDFEVTVPSHADLELLTGVGDLWVTGVSGQLSLQSERGSIRVRAARLSGNGVLKTHRGSIDCQGAIDPSGTYCFATEWGAIRLILPDESAFELDARTRFGRITTAVPGMSLGFRTNGEAHGDAGLPPRSSLKLRSFVGSVSVIGESRTDDPARHGR